MAEATQSAPLTNRQLAMRSLKRRLRLDWQLYLIILLPLIWLIVFCYVPMYGVQIAFKKFQSSKGIFGSPWIGFENFTRFFNSYNFTKIIWNTISVSIYSLIAGFPFPIILAMLLNNCVYKTYKKIVQMVTYLPYFISTVVLVGMLVQFLSPRVGIINKILGIFGVPATDFMAMPSAFRHIYVWSGVWQGTGFGCVIYLAALAGIDPGLHEAAMIDGASRLQRMWHIDVPGILPTATILLIMNTGNVMNVGFEKAYLMQNTLNMDASEVISTYVYKVGLASAAADFSYSTAIGLFNSVINLVMISTVNAISNKLSDTSIW